MSRINEKMGLKAAGARARLNSLSGVACPECRGCHVISNKVHGHLLWLCGFCSYAWSPTVAEIGAYNRRVRERDRIAL